ncbi:hydrolase [Eikenella sp. S3360]|uniref:Hydrolase n=1 Tax=Eikenella glucosivorans TaxID=2766967 RepID=A0ABS0N7A5_9NEIS|nr:HD domain-containing protein [Eikenella glucosivorans]MBH5328193.1 hydrolase [Eikenella glucosivorans]
MRTPTITRETAVELLKQYNKEPFHIYHAYAVEAMMRWYAEEFGFGDEVDYWGMVGLLHDIDFEMFPEEHCVKCAEILRDAGVGEDMIFSICCHGYEEYVDLVPEHTMEKVLFAADELTGLIGAATLMRPSKSSKDMDVKSVKKKFKDKSFAAGCSREAMTKGAELLGWEMNELFQKTLSAVQATEDPVKALMDEYHASQAAQ